MDDITRREFAAAASGCVSTASLVTAKQLYKNQDTGNDLQPPPERPGISDDSLTVAYITDGHYKDRGAYSRDYRRFHDRLQDRLFDIDPDLLLMGGDQICHPNAGARAAAVEVVDLFDDVAPILAAHGNHDHMTDADWIDAYNHPKNHRTEVGDIGIITLDTARPDSSQKPVNKEFLRNSLRDYSQKDAVLIMSHYWYNAKYDDIMTGSGKSEILEEDVSDIIHGQENVVSILHGHNHGHESGDVYHISHGGVSKPYISGRAFGGTRAQDVTEGFWVLQIDVEQNLVLADCIGIRFARPISWDVFRY